MARFTVKIELLDDGRTATSINLNGSITDVELMQIGYTCNKLKHVVFDKLAEKNMDMAMSFFIGSMAEQSGLLDDGKEG